jgi:hypothetical protein
MSDLDGLIAQGLYARIPFWIDEFMKTGIPWVEILATMTRWFNERRSIQALRALADAVIHRGTREHLSVLNILEGMPEPAASQLIADTQYAVRRRSLR